MSPHLSRWVYLSQVVVQRTTLAFLLSLAVAGALWSLAAAAGIVPWLGLEARLGGGTVDAGPAAQLALTRFRHGRAAREAALLLPSAPKNLTATLFGSEIPPCDFVASDV